MADLVLSNATDANRFVVGQPVIMSGAPVWWRRLWRWLFRRRIAAVVVTGVDYERGVITYSEAPRG